MVCGTSKRHELNLDIGQGFDLDLGLAFCRDWQDIEPRCHRIETDAYGLLDDARCLDGSELAVDEEPLYHGQDIDPDVGLLNYRARAFCPAQGRFIVHEPLKPDVSGTSPGVSQRGVGTES